MSEDESPPSRPGAPTVVSSPEHARLKALRALEILDTPPEERFDRITSLAAESFDVPIALISLVDEDRQWFKSRVGLEASETSRSVSFCAHAIEGEETLIVPDATRDPRFVDNPLVTEDPGVRFYAGHPLHALDGSRLGTLCIISHVPRELSARQHAALVELAGLAEDELSAGRVQLDDYRLCEVIGRGGMGVVYRAFDESLERDVALKVVHRTHLHSPLARDRFLREARALAAVSHTNVLTVYRVLRVGAVTALVCELLRGGTWQGRIDETGAIDPLEVVRIGAGVARGLEAVHGMGLVHRDLKPANVFFDHAGTAKLGDFGLARSMLGPPEPAEEATGTGAAQGGGSGSLSGLTEVGTVSGTPGFLAPELLAGTAATTASDVFALGTTLYEALVGEARQDDEPSPRASGTRVPPRLDALVVRMLATDPVRRPTVAECRAELDALLRHGPR